MTYRVPDMPIPGPPRPWTFDLATWSGYWAASGRRIVPGYIDHNDKKRPIPKDWRRIPYRSPTEIMDLTEWSDPETLIFWVLDTTDVVFDIDSRNGGQLSLKRLQQHGLDVTDTPVVFQTHSGDHHYVFHNPDGWPLRKNNSGQLPGAPFETPGVDFLTEGAGMVLPPSIGPSGNRYRFEQWDQLWLRGADLPAWCRTNESDGRQRRRKKSRADSTWTPKSIVTPNRGEAVSTAYAHAAIRRELEAVMDAPAGSVNERLLAASRNVGQIAAANRLDVEQVVNLLLGAAREYVNRDGIEAAKATIASGLSWGMEHPRGRT